MTVLELSSGWLLRVGSSHSGSAICLVGVGQPISILARGTNGYSMARPRQPQSPNPKNVTASSTGLRCDTTALAGKLSSGQPMAMQV